MAVPVPRVRIGLTSPVRQEDGTVLVTGTDVRWRTLPGWIAACLRVGAVVRCCERHRARCARVYRSLDVTRDVRGCSDADHFAQLAAFLARGSASRGGLPAGWPLWRVFGRAELGLLRMAAHNRLGQVRAGHGTAPRPKGPRLDPARLPGDALDRLIQHHPDMGLVERLRAERARRAAAAS